MISGDMIETGIKKHVRHVVVSGSSVAFNISWGFPEKLVLAAGWSGHQSYRFLPFSASWSGLTGRLFRLKTSKNNFHLGVLPVVIISPA